MERSDKGRQEMSALKALPLEMMEERLKQQIFGQDEAVERICRMFEQGSGTSETISEAEKRPGLAGAILLAGPVGCGKTLLARLASEFALGGTQNLHRFCVRPYRLPFDQGEVLGTQVRSVRELETGLLAERIRGQARTVLFFDEIDRAQPGVLAYLLRVMEEGRVQAADGSWVSLADTYFVYTSHAGAQEAACTGSEAEAEGIVREENCWHFAQAGCPDFLDYFVKRDACVVLHRLESETVREIMLFQMKRMKDMVWHMAGIEVSWLPEVLQQLMEKWEEYRAIVGAHAVCRILYRYFEEPLRECVLDLSPDETDLTGAQLEILEICGEGDPWFSCRIEGI